VGVCASVALSRSEEGVGGRGVAKAGGS
jgi:hypothetical protein